MPQLQDSNPVPTNLSAQLHQDVIIFTSPKAGSGASREQIPRLKDLLEQAGTKVDVVTDPDALRGEIENAQPSGDDRPLVVAAGGDGTLGLVVANTDVHTSIVPMPMGTENLLARHFGQSNQAEQVLQTIQDGETVQLDAGSANGKLFLIMATIGFDAEVVRRLHLRRKGHIWRLSYLLPLLTTIAKYRFPKIKVRAWDATGKVVEDRTVRWAMVFNLPRYAAGLAIEPDASADDGQLDLICFARGSIVSGMQYFLSVLSRSHRRDRTVYRHRVHRVELTGNDRIAYQTDGDYAGRLPLKIEVLPGRVRLRVPAGGSIR